MTNFKKEPNKIGRFKVEVSFWLFSISLISGISSSSETFSKIYPTSDIYVIPQYIMFLYTLIAMFRIFYLISKYFKPKNKNKNLDLLERIVKKELSLKKEKEKYEKLVNKYIEKNVDKDEWKSIDKAIMKLPESETKLKLYDMLYDLEEKNKS